MLKPLWTQTWQEAIYRKKDSSPFGGSHSLSWRGRLCVWWLLGILAYQTSSRLDYKPQHSVFLQYSSYSSEGLPLKESTTTQISITHWRTSVQTREGDISNPNHYSATFSPLPRVFSTYLDMCKSWENTFDYIVISNCVGQFRWGPCM